MLLWILPILFLGCLKESKKCVPQYLVTWSQVTLEYLIESHFSSLTLQQHVYITVQLHKLAPKPRGLPSQVKGDRFRAYSRRSSCVRIAPPAYGPTDNSDHQLSARSTPLGAALLEIQPVADTKCPQGCPLMVCVNVFFSALSSFNKYLTTTLVCSR